MVVTMVKVMTMKVISDAEVHSVEDDVVIVRDDGGKVLQMEEDFDDGEIIGPTRLQI